MAAPSPLPFGQLESSEQRWRGYMAGIRAGDSRSLALLYDETSAILYGLALRILNEPAAAEAVMLSAYQQLWEARQASGSVLATLVGFTRNGAVARLPRASLRPPQVFRAATGPGLEARTSLHPERNLAQGALQRLTPEQREVIELAFFQGMSEAELAAALGASPSTIRKRIRTGMSRLRDGLRPVVSMENVS